MLHDRHSSFWTSLFLAPLLAIVCILGCSPPAGSLKQPNIIVIFIDDMGWSDLPSFGGTRVKMENIGRLAKDHQLGPLFERIDNDQQLRDNTVIVVASDNGPGKRAGSSEPLRGGKGMLYEGGVRSPLIVWGPGLLANESAGTVNDSSVFSAIDLTRSLYSLAGTQPPGDVLLDGEDLAGTLLGKVEKSRSAPIFWRRPPEFRANGEEDLPDLAVRDGKWKFYVNYNGSGEELYDLRADTSENHNLVGQLPKVVARLRKAVFEWNATLPADAGDKG